MYIVFDQTRTIRLGTFRTLAEAALFVSKDPAKYIIVDAISEQVVQPPTMLLEG